MRLLASYTRPGCGPALRRYLSWPSARAKTRLLASPSCVDAPYADGYVERCQVIVG